VIAIAQPSVQAGGVKVDLDNRIQNRRSERILPEMLLGRNGFIQALHPSIIESERNLEEQPCSG
jgi:hypothetical protein